MRALAVVMAVALASTGMGPAAVTPAQAQDKESPARPADRA